MNFELAENGSKKVSPFYVCFRGSYAAQGELLNSVMKQYKYIRLYDTAVIPVPNTNEIKNSANMATNWNVSSATSIVTLTTTDVAISSLNLTDDGETFFEHITGASDSWATIIIGLHD